MTYEITDTQTIEHAAQTALLAAEADPAKATALATAQDERWRNAEDVRGFATLPSTTDVPQVYAAIDTAERTLVAPNRLAVEYGPGMAAYQDHLLFTGSVPKVLIEAQHATMVVRKKTGLFGDPDHGTAGLAHRLAEHELGRAIIPIGLQSGNANVDKAHPLKDALRQEWQAGSYKGFLSVHGMRSGKTVNLLDEREVHAVIGLGNNPNGVSIEAAQEIVRRLREFNLNVLIGNQTPHLNFKKAEGWDGEAFRDAGYQLETRDETGTPKAIRLAALMANSTVNFMHGIVEAAGAPKPVMQIEMARSLRLTPEDKWVRADPTATPVGVFLGYQVMATAAEVCGTIS